MKLFDDIARTDKSTQKQRKSYYGVINCSARTEYEAARLVLETWFLDYPSVPEHNRASLRGKFRSAENYNHLSAFFELYTHALLKHQGFFVYPEYSVVHMVSRPIDFFVKPPNDLPFYVEAVVAMDSQAEVESEKRLEELRQSLRKINDPNFRLDFKWERTSEKQLPTAQMRIDLQKLLRELDTSKYSMGEEKREFATYELNGWKLLFFAIPRSKQGYLKHPVLGQPVSAQWASREISLRKNLEEKAEENRYGHLEYPYIIAANVLALNSLGCDLEEVFFGKEVYQFNTESGEGTSTRSPLLPDRPYSENGFWLAREKWRNEHISAALLVNGLWPLSVAHTTPILWHNPSAAKPLNHDIWQGPQMIFDLNASCWNFREGKHPWEILHLPEDWPNMNT